MTENKSMNDSMVALTNKVNSAELIYQILVTSDIHGSIYPTDYRTSEEQPWGLAKLATLIRRERQRYPGLLLLDNGDSLQGTPLCSYFVKYRKDEMHPAIEVMNKLGYDAAVPGNHEFNYGAEVLRRAVEQSRFPWLSAGIVEAESGEPAFGKPYILQTTEEGIRIAVLGVTTHYIPNWENPRHIADWTFRDVLETVKAWVPRIRDEERPDLLIVSYHGGFECDLDTGEPSERLTGENQGSAICREVPGIDILITGHQHRRIAGEIEGVTILQPGYNGQALGKLVVRFQHHQDGWRIAGKTAELLVPDADIPADEQVLEWIAPVEAETQAWLDQPIGCVNGDMSISSAFECRLADHPFIEFVNRVQMEAAGVDISNTALLSEQSGGFQGSITMRDVLTNFMYPNTLTVLRLTGRDIRMALEQTAGYFVVDDSNKVAINPDYIQPKPQHYNYDMWEGIEYELAVDRPAGERVVKLNYHGTPLPDETEVDVVMNNYRAGGGGDYEMYRGKPIIREIQQDMAELVAEYIARTGTIAASCDQNWRVTVQGVGVIC
ncbi:bifunctional metallophosphatase/5'-nucleotidase [Paenibacillus sanguinis]|uniref:bifunctional metallophosphatase/5'-nucleotidase n=1 Tax=Paenibacillus sanguinis TaxID=225906 RepID=UPI00037DD415|nr:bifunctional UDP-sugar hydrolase/5'-nucleotidase [Paenibacillus sanguinis]